ncbi:hypothetical protein DOTSEDRAFT_156871, partial [Dothistroma septosporum NZE10]
MARGKRHKRRASKDLNALPKKAQRAKKTPVKRMAAEIALQNEEILHSIISSLPLLERLVARRIAKHWTNAVNSFSDLHAFPFFEPQDAPHEFIYWGTYDRLNNLGPYITAALYEDDVQAFS